MNDRRTVEDSDENLKNFFLQEKPSEMIVVLYRQNSSYASELSSKVDTTYSHAVKIMNRMKAAGLVTSQRKGRKKEYMLTEKGEKLAENLDNIFNNVDGIDSEEDGTDRRWGLQKLNKS